MGEGEKVGEKDRKIAEFQNVQGFAGFCKLFNLYSE